MKIVICPKCNKEAPWVENKERYGRNYGKSYMCYYCKPCGTYVGCHNNTRNPLGTMADRETMNWRMKTHSLIDPLWKSGKISRGKVYKKLQDIIGGDVHVGSSDIERCKKIIEAVPLII